MRRPSSSTSIGSVIYRFLEVTKPPFSQPPLPAPARVPWAIDRTGLADRPYFFELHYDGMASGFRVIDTSGQQRVLQLPIAGSGVWGPETCMSTPHAEGKITNGTWRSIDDATYRDFAAARSRFHSGIPTAAGND